MSQISISGILFAFDIAVKATLILLVTGAALLCLRGASGATRHLVGTFGLAAALLLPVLSVALPRVRLPLLPDFRPAVSVFPSSVRAAGRLEAAPEISRHLLALSVPEKAVFDAVPNVLQPAAPAPVAPNPRERFPWPGAGLALWIAGSLLVGARLCVGWLRVRRFAREGSPIRDSAWIDERDSVARRLELDRAVDLLESAAVPVAMTSGWRRPVLLIGHAARLWALERRRVVLLHELAHVKRADWIALVLAEVAVALYWFHPVAWWLGRQVRRDAETACDDLVISAGTKPSVYAGHLLGIFRSLASPHHPVAPALAIARPHHFEERLRAILDPRAPRKEQTRGRGRFYAATLLAAAVAVAAVEPWKPALAGASVQPSRAIARLASPATRGKCATSAPAAHPGKVVPVVPAVEAAEAESPGETTEPPAEAGRAVPAIWQAAPGALAEIASGFVKASSRRAPQSGSAWYGRGMDLYNDAKYAEAAEAFQKAAEAGYKEGTSSYNAACSYALEGNRDQAFGWLNRALEAGFDVASYVGHDDDLDDLKSDPRWAALKKTVREQKSSKEENKARAVVARYERVSARSPRSGEALFDVGRDLLHVDRYDLAAKAFQASADLGNRVGTSLYNEACALSLAGDTNGALELLSRALDAGFDQPHLFKEDDDLDSVRSDPRFAPLEREARELSLPGYGFRFWGNRSSARTKWRDAARRYDAYAQKNPSRGRAWFNLGFASLAGDRPEEAAKAFARALDLGYRKPTTMYNLACTYSRLDQRDVAFDWLFKALEAGFDEAWTIRFDDDLDNLRGDPRYRKALAIAKARGKDADDERD